nr:ATP-binding protein [Tomitella biformata]
MTSAPEYPTPEPPPRPALDIPPLARRRHGVVGGVAGGVADHLGVAPLKVRVAFTLLSVLAGAGVVAYGLLWIFMPEGAGEGETSATERLQARGLALLGVAAALGSTWVVSGGVGSVILPLIVVAVGAGLVWREFDADGPRTLMGWPRQPTVLTWARVVGGVSLVVLGLGVVVIARVDFASLGSSLLAVVVALVGVALLSVPIWLRTVRALNEERAARVRTEAREEIASHLHDSVLQTLALIQKRPEQTQEVLRLARSQERELRKWLFGEVGGEHRSLAEALRTVCGEVEDHHGVSVETVTVGDLEFGSAGPGPDMMALLGATREALVNAAKHSGQTRVDLYAEVEPGQVSVFVRDRGVGFDPAAVQSDRQGLAKSVHGRMGRHGGTASVRSSVGSGTESSGTEVRMSMPRETMERTDL